MIIGIPKEIKHKEFRVSMTPNCVNELTKLGHNVIIENNAGSEIGYTNDNYLNVGAKVVDSAVEVFEKAELIVKVKEPQPSECKMLKPGQILFTYLHLASNRQLTQDLIDSKCISIAYETVTDKDGKLPLLTPMSEIAGQLSVQFGASSLRKHKGGKGILLSGIPGVKPTTVIIIGGGIVGVNAAKIAVGMNADVYIMDTNIDVLRYIDNLFRGRIKTIFCNKSSIEKMISIADLIIGAVLIHGGAAPKLITKNMLKLMDKGTVIVDVAIDQGGCTETSVPTTLDDPTYIVDDIIHYCVPNMPSSVPISATQALNNATIPFIIELANHGWRNALNNRYLRNGLNICNGKVVYKNVADAFGLECFNYNDL